MDDASRFQVAAPGLIANAIAKDFDAILFDIPARSAFFRDLTARAATLVLVSPPTFHGLRETMALLDAAEKTGGVKKTIIVLNKLGEFRSGFVGPEAFKQQSSKGSRPEFRQAIQIVALPYAPKQAIVASNTSESMLNDASAPIAKGILNLLNDLPTAPAARKRGGFLLQDHRILNIMTQQRFSLGRKETTGVELAAERLGALQQVSLDTQNAVSRKLYERIKPDVVDKIDREALLHMIERAVSDIADEDKLHISADQQKTLASLLADDMKGIGPLQRLLQEHDITDIMVNGPNRVFVERKGRLSLTNIHFRDDDHVRAIAQRIARGIGRRVDDANPICDARLADGSRVCIVISPIAIDGTLISITKIPQPEHRPR